MDKQLTLEEIDAKRKMARDQELEDIRAIIHTPQGIRFFKRMMNDGQVFKEVFTGNSNVYFQQGCRYMALSYFHDICEVAPGKVYDVLFEKGKGKV